MQSVFHILLAFQIVVSSMGLRVGMHFCGHELESISFTGVAPPCTHHLKRDDKASQGHCHHSNTMDSNSRNCCQDKNLQIEATDQKRIVQEQTEAPSALAAFLIPPPASFEINLPVFTPFVDLYYVPPLHYRDKVVVFQSFLI